MDTNQLISHSRTRFDHLQSKRLLKEKYQGKLVFAHQGGMFRAAPEMIAFLNLYGSQTIVLEDLYETPVQVNANELCEVMKQRWQEQMNAWLLEYHALNQNR
jgi:hypothetical protein